MKFEMTAAEKKDLVAAVASNPIHKWFQYRDNMKFTIGDVLIKMIKRYVRETSSYIMVPENIESNTKMAQRYLYVFEDQYGIGYVKKLRVSDGSLGKELICIPNLDLDQCTFQVDPEYAEHVILDAEFDIKEIHKRSLEGKKMASKANRKIGVKPSTLKEYNDFAEKLTVGGKFYTSHDYTGHYIQEFEVLAIIKVPVATLERKSEWHWRKFKERGTDVVDSTYSYNIKYKSQYGLKEGDIYEMRGGVLYTQQPSKDEGTK